MTLTIKQTRFQLLPIGEYTAKITDIDADDGKFGPQVRFEFEIQGGDYSGQTLLAWASATFSPRSKLYAWTRAALGSDILPDYDFNSDDLLGRMVMVTVVIRPNDDGAEFNRVENIRPYRPKRNGGSQKLPPSEHDEIPF
jgi:hypothetical protein